MSSPSPPLEPRAGSPMQQDQGTGLEDRYDVTQGEEPESVGNDGQPKVTTTTTTNNTQSQGPIDIFGMDDSDLTEQSDSEDSSSSSSDSEDGDTRRKATTPPRNASSRSGSPRSGDREVTRGGDSEDDRRHEGGDYEEDEDDDERDRALKGMKIKKRKGGEKGVEGGDEVVSRPKKSKKKSSKRSDPSSQQQNERGVQSEPEEEIDPETRRRQELRAKIDAAAKGKIGGRKGGKKKKVQDEEDIEMMNDEAVATLRSKMLQAADRDIEENEMGRPAVHKLRLLPQVVELMQKTALAETIVEGGMLEAVKRWLEPLGDKSLPALNIQRPLFNILRTFTIETSALKSSELGKIVYFYTKCRRVEPSIARLANQLVSDWMRPILRRSKAFVDREVEFEGQESNSTTRFGRSSHRNAQQVEAEVEASGGGGGGQGGQRRARIPQAMTQTFSVAPQSNLTGSGALNAVGGGNASSQARMREYKKKIQLGQQAARRV